MVAAVATTLIAVPMLAGVAHGNEGEGADAIVAVPTDTMDATGTGSESPDLTLATLKVEEKSEVAGKTDAPDAEADERTSDDQSAAGDTGSDADSQLVVVGDSTATTTEVVAATKDVAKMTAEEKSTTSTSVDVEVCVTAQTSMMAYEVLTAAGAFVDFGEVGSLPAGACQVYTVPGLDPGDYSATFSGVVNGPGGFEYPWASVDFTIKSAGGGDPTDPGPDPTCEEEGTCTTPPPCEGPDCDEPGPDPTPTPTGSSSATPTTSPAAAPTDQPTATATQVAAAVAPASLASTGAGGIVAVIVAVIMLLAVGVAALVIRQRAQAS